MSRKMLIDATHPEETRVVVVNGEQVEEFDLESSNRVQISGNIYLGKVLRVEPSLQAAFVDYGGNRHGFLPLSEIHPDYFKIPDASRKALLQDAHSIQEEADSPDDDGDVITGSNNTEKSPEAPLESNIPASDSDADADAPSGANSAPSDIAEEAGLREKTIAAKPKRRAYRKKKQPDNGENPATEADIDSYVPDSNGAQALKRPSFADADISDDISYKRARQSFTNKYKIQEVIRPRQILLVQINKEERGNKGAALTTYISLPGRFCVLMPNTPKGGGISRKISNPDDRSSLKSIIAELEIPGGAGLIIRTAGAKRTRSEIRRDYAYLQRLWDDIRTLTISSIAPTIIYQEGNLIKRSIRDLYNREINEIVVAGKDGYQMAKKFMKVIMPSHGRNVHLYEQPLPIFVHYKIENYLSNLLNPTIQLKSGAYIVINVTEALVAIDINSGQSTLTGSVKDMALKTNLEAADEICRQLRLRDLAGLIVIDFIDMKDGADNNAVEMQMKKNLRADRARIRVGRISGFGLLEMSRQRLRFGLEEATTQRCATCNGTGLLRSDDIQALHIIRLIEEKALKVNASEIRIQVAPSVMNFLFNNKRDAIRGLEDKHSVAIYIEANPAISSGMYEFIDSAPQKPKRPVNKTKAAISPDVVLTESEIIEAEGKSESSSDDGKAEQPAARKGGKKAASKAKKSDPKLAAAAADSDSAQSADSEAASGGSAEDAATAPAESNKKSKAVKPRANRSRKSAQKPKTSVVSEQDADAKGDIAQSDAADAVDVAKESKKPAAKKSKSAASSTASGTASAAKKSPAKPKAKPKAKSKAQEKKNPKSEAPPPAPEESKATANIAAANANIVAFEANEAAQSEKVADSPKPKPKRRGWWSVNSTSGQP